MAIKRLANHRKAVIFERAARVGYLADTFIVIFLVDLQADKTIPN
jgi:hypothetical protein